MDTELQILLAKQAITEQLYTYCRSFDRLDDELALSVWHEGGTVQYANGPVQPLTEYLPPSTGLRSTLLNCSHQITNILIQVKGDKAVSEAYVTASLQERPDENKQMAENLYRGRYIDRWSFQRGKWAIDHRQFLPDSFTRIEFTNAFAGSDFLEVAKRDRTDPSYAVFKAI
jgi:hypothetical protein